MGYKFSDCGSGYVRREELEAANERLANYAKSIRCIYCNKHYTAEQKDELADHILSCEKSPLVQMVKEMESRITDYMDMMNDEFMRIISICRTLPTDESEILGICQRAMMVIAQKVPVIKQRDEAIKELDAAKAEVGRLREALDKVRGFGKGDMGYLELCDYVTSVAEEALGKDSA